MHGIQGKKLVCMTAMGPSVKMISSNGLNDCMFSKTNDFYRNVNNCVLEKVEDCRNNVLSPSV